MRPFFSILTAGLIFLAFILPGCAGSPYRTSRMSSSEIQSVTDHQLHRAISNDVIRNRTIINEAVRRGIITEKEGDLIQRKQVAIGMSESAMVLSWGKPRRMNRTVNAFGVRKQCVYGQLTKRSKPTYVYVENGFITSWQD